jgi:hypothetical protein
MLWVSVIWGEKRAVGQLFRTDSEERRASLAPLHDMT